MAEGRRPVEGKVSVAFGSSDGLGPCDFKDFVAQSHTPDDHCVRFAVVVAFHDATLVIGRALPLSRTGLSPAGPRQLRLARSSAGSQIEELTHPAPIGHISLSVATSVPTRSGDQAPSSSGPAPRSAKMSRWKNRSQRGAGIRPS